MHNTPSHPRYRPDIDGLRALAVLLVVIFHAFPGLVSGGFIGVDIFFVISGYLISSIIFSGFQAGDFSFREFYARRIRRIFPALITVLVASFAFGWLVLMSDEYKALGKHMLGASLFISNLLLLKEGGYFDVAVIEKPLLHLWSLGIEEQFYILWPLLLCLAWKMKINFKWPILVIVALSFSWNLGAVFGLHLNVAALSGQTILEFLARAYNLPSFYQPQARFWELLVGAAIAYFHLYPRTTVQLQIKRRAWGSLIGMGLIVAGFLCINTDSIFPGLWALLPVVGTALIICAGENAWLNRRVLSSRHFVAIGKISYPLYLWHWPILSFAYIVHGEETTSVVRVGCVALAFVLAWLTYRYIESPIRTGAYRAQKTAILILAMVIIGIGGYITYHSGGIPSRDFARRTQPLVQATSDWQYPGDFLAQPLAGLERADPNNGIYTSSLKPPEILFLGDSHIMQFGPRVSKVSKAKKIPVMFVAGSGCMMIPSVARADHPYCTLLMDHFNKMIAEQPDIKTIVIGGHWNAYFLVKIDLHNADTGEALSLQTDEGRQFVLAELQTFLRALSKKHTVYLVLDNPLMLQLRPSSVINRFAYNGIGSMRHHIEIPSEQLELNDQLRLIGRAAGARIIDQIPHLCRGSACLRIEPNGMFVYKDEDHLAPHYVSERASYIDEVFSAH